MTPLSLVAVLLMNAAMVLGAATSAPTKITIAPTMPSIDDKRLYSYFCLEQEQRLCLGISTSDGAPVYNPSNPYYMQVKRRDNNEAKGTDGYKMRWAVDRVNGIIQLSNYAEFCVQKERADLSTPGNIVVTPCGQGSDLELFELSEFLQNVNEEGAIRLKSDPSQCLTMMHCQRMSMDYCNPAVKTMFTGDTININNQRGAWVRLMPCVDPSHPGYKSQIWRQTIDCAPGCSPYMIYGEDNVCDQECNNAACTWDNWACTTQSPTPPTPRPSRSPTTSPTTSVPTKSPSRSPTTPRPSTSPTTSRPSTSPTTSPTTSAPSRAPSQSPTTSPTTSAPTRSPSRSPTTSPTTSRPSLSPSRSPTRSPETVAPTPSPTNFPTVSPTNSPSTSPTVQPTRSPTVNVTELTTVVAVVAPFPWWIIVLVLLLLLCCCCVCFAVGARRRRRKEEEKRIEEKERDLERGPETPPRATKSTEVSPIPVVITREPSTNKIDDEGTVQITVEEPPKPRRPSFEDLESRGAVGLLWGGNEHDSTQELTSERAQLKRRSEKLTREQLKDVLNQRSFTMPLEEVVEVASEDENDDRSVRSRGESIIKTYSRPHSSSNFALVDAAADFYAEPPSIVQSVNVEGMSIKELKSFIVENGGDFEGCQEKDQLIARAKAFA